MWKKAMAFSMSMRRPQRSTRWATDGSSWLVNSRMGLSWPMSVTAIRRSVPGVVGQLDAPAGVTEVDALPGVAGHSPNGGEDVFGASAVPGRGIPWCRGRRGGRAA